MEARPAHLAAAFNVNVIEVQRVTTAFLPLSKAGQQKKVINMYLNIHVPGQEEAWGRHDGNEIEWRGRTNFVDIAPPLRLEDSITDL